MELMRTPLSSTIMSMPPLLPLLAVGDGAFRQKSEAKMHEIIKGGATTILVSHSIHQVRSLCNKILWLHKGQQVVFTDDVEGACDCYEEFLKGGGAPAVYDPIAARKRIDARAAAKARKEAEYRQMKIDAGKLKKVREILRKGMIAFPDTYGEVGKGGGK